MLTSKPTGNGLTRSLGEQNQETVFICGSTESGNSQIFNQGWRQNWDLVIIKLSGPNQLCGFLDVCLYGCLEQEDPPGLVLVEES